MNSKRTRVQQSFRTKLNLVGGAATLALLTWDSGGAQAQTVIPPLASDFYFQTNSPRRCARIGDWYTTLGVGVDPNDGGPNCGTTFGGLADTNNTERSHRFSFNITAEDLAAGGGTATITVVDAESFNSPAPPAAGAVPDEVDGINPNIGGVGTPDPTRFVLYQLVDNDAILGGDPTGQPVIGEQTFRGGPDGQNATFTVSAAGTYLLTSETGALLIDGDPNPDLNNDDNSFRLLIPNIADLNAGQFRGSFQQTSGAPRALTAFFLVGPQPGGTSLFLRNFDLDDDILAGGGGVVTYSFQAPGGGTDTVPGTVSNNATWNGPTPTLNDGGDLVPLNGRFGRWNIELSQVPNRNQGIIEVNIGNRDIPISITPNPPQRAGNFTVVEDTTLSTSVNVAVDHPFTITNSFFTNDIYQLQLTGTDPTYTVVVIDPDTDQPLTDADNDGRVETPIVPPNESKELILRVTPTDPNVIQDQTTITVTSFMDEQVRAQANNPDPPTELSVLKTTDIAELDFLITPDGTEFTTIGTPARHDFEVSVTGTAPQPLTLVPSGTDPNFDIQIINRATGEPLPQTNGEFTTGTLNPGDPPLELTLLVTPQPGAPTTDTTVITARNPDGDEQSITRITELANFTIDPDTEISTEIEQPIDHPFTVTNIGTVPDVINLVPEGTDPNYTVELIDPATGNPVPDTNGDNIPDTGELLPGGSIDLILRVTPGPNATTNDTTIIRGTSTTTGANLTVEKRTIIQPADFIITPDSDLFTNIGRPARHDFEVTITGANPDTIDLTTSGTDPNYTVNIVNRATGQPLTDTDNDGVIDTGSLNPNEPALLTLLVTPQDGATVPDTTIVTGTNSNGDTQQVTKITRLANFSLTDNGELQTRIGQPVDHPFTVTNLGTGPDIINLVPEGTDPNYTVELIDPATGNPVPDTNGDNIPDTGELPPGGNVDLILRVTPGPNATSPDNTVIRGTSVDTGADLTITRITSLPDEGPVDISLIKRITRVYRANTGQVETYDTEDSASLPDGFVGVTSPTPQELDSGDLVEYTVYFLNQSSGRVLDLEICDPIPTESSFVPDPTTVSEFQDLYGGGRGIAYDVPSTLPLGNGDSLSNVFDGDQGEFVNPLAPRASCPGQTSGNQGAVVVRVGPVDPGQAGFVKFVTRLE